MLLIGCPCALVISTPAAIAAGLSAGARRGLLLKGGAVLESLGNVTIVALRQDRHADRRQAEGDRHRRRLDAASSEVLSLAAALETGSSHPLAVAILARAKADRVADPAGRRRRRQSPARASPAGWAAIELFLGSPQAAEERAALGDDLRARIAALNDDGKTVSRRWSPATRSPA